MHNDPIHTDQVVLRVGEIEAIPIMQHCARLKLNRTHRKREHYTMSPQWSGYSYHCLRRVGNLGVVVVAQKRRAC